jgi:hypothetical protein
MVSFHVSEQQAARNGIMMKYQVQVLGLITGSRPADVGDM